MPKPSPSPPVTITVKSWFASFTPVATASARPCNVCMPYVLMNPGKFDEQPMPLMVTTSWFGICNSTSAFWTAASTPKSPHPGHQSGSTLPFKSAIVTCHCGASAVAMLLVSLETNFEISQACQSERSKESPTSHQNLVLRNRQPALPTQLFPNRIHEVVRHERLPIVFANVPVRHKAGLTAQIARKLPAVVVLDDDRVPRALEDLENRLAVQRHQPANLQLIRRNPLLVKNLASLFDHSLGRSPSDQRDIGVARSPQLRWGNRRRNPRRLAHAFFHHGAPLGRIGEFVADQHAVLIMLVAGRRVRITRHAGNSAWRNPAHRDLVALISSVPVLLRRSDELSPIDDRFEVQLLRIDTEPALRQQQVRQHDPRALEAIRKIENFRNDIEAVANIERTSNHPRIIAERRAQHLPKIALLRFCRNPGRGSGPLAVDHHHRSLHHGREPEPFGHQCKPSTRSGAHGTHSRVSRSDRHVHHANLVL